MAHRHGMGNLVWVGWVPGKKPSQLGVGSHCIMLSKDGMVHLSRAFCSGEIERRDVDLALKHWLTTGDNAQQMGACYMYPPMGGFIRHESGCDPRRYGAGTGGRPSAWEEGGNPASGTRQAEDPCQRGKYLIQWREGGSAHRLWLPAPTDQELVTTKYRWYSIREPTASGTSSSSQQVKKEEETDTEDKSVSPAEHPSKRFKRAERQHNVREVFRWFTTNPAEAAVKKNRFLFFGCP